MNFTSQQIVEAATWAMTGWTFGVLIRRMGHDLKKRVRALRFFNAWEYDADRWQGRIHIDTSTWGIGIELSEAHMDPLYYLGKISRLSIGPVHFLVAWKRDPHGS